MEEALTDKETGREVAILREELQKRHWDCSDLEYVYNGAAVYAQRGKKIVALLTGDVMVLDET